MADGGVAPTPVETAQFVEVFVPSAGYAPDRCVVYKHAARPDAQRYSYRLAVDDVAGDAAADLVQKAARRDVLTPEVVYQERADGVVLKERRYVESVADVPEGYTPERGPKGGIYYETNPANSPADRPRAGAPSQSVNYAGEPVLAVHLGDVEAGDRVAFEHPDTGDRDVGRVTDPDPGGDGDLVIVRTGDGLQPVQAERFDGAADTAKADGGGDGGGSGDAAVTTDTAGVHSAVYSDQDDEDEDEDADDVAKDCDGHHLGPYEEDGLAAGDGEILCEPAGEVYEEALIDGMKGRCPFCDQVVSIADLYAEDHVEKEAANVWTYYYGPQGGEGWLNLQTGEIRYQQQRPGEPPEGGDGHDDWLAEGWAEPPDDPDELLPGQTVEINVRDEYREAEVVGVNPDGSVEIDAENLGDTVDMGLDKVTAVEEYSIEDLAADLGLSTDLDDAADWAQVHGIEPGETVLVDPGQADVPDDGPAELTIVGYQSSGLPAVRGEEAAAAFEKPDMEGTNIGVDLDNLPNFEDPFGWDSDDLERADAAGYPAVAAALSADERAEIDDYLTHKRVPPGFDVGQLEPGDPVIVYDEFLEETDHLTVVDPINGKFALENEDGGTYFPLGGASDVTIAAVPGKYVDDEPPADAAADATADSAGEQDPQDVAADDAAESADSGAQAAAADADDSDGDGWRAWTHDADLASYEPAYMVEEWGDLSEFGFPAGVTAANMKVGAMPGWDGESNEGLIFATEYGPGGEKVDLGNRQMVTYTLGEAMGANIPQHVGSPADGAVYAKGVEGADIGAAPAEYLDQADPEQFYEQAAYQIILGNNDAHHQNVKVTPDGDLVFHDVDHAAGDVTSDFVGEKTWYDSAIDRVLGELWRSGKHVVTDDKQDAKQRMLATAQEVARRFVADDGSLADDLAAVVTEDASGYDSDLASNVVNNVINLAEGNVTWQ